MRLRKLILPAVAGAAVYYALFGGEYSLLDLKRMEHEQVQESQRVEQLHRENAILQRHADSLANDRSALERIARERYGMIGPGERLYRFVDTLDATPADTAH